MTTEHLLSEEEVMAQASKTIDAGPTIDEIETLFKTETTFDVNGEIISVREFKFGELPKALQLVKTFGGVFAHHYKNGTLETMNAVMDICSIGGEELISLLALNVGKPREWFDTVPTDVGVSMMLTFLKVNISFFSQRVVPVLSNGMVSLTTRGQ